MESIMPAGKHRVLILESDPGMCRLLQDELRDEGYRVEEVADCREAREGWGSGAFDVVVADLEIPGRRGLELLEELKRQMPGVPIIALAGLGDFQAQREALAQGARACLNKPLKMSWLKSALRMALRET